MEKMIAALVFGSLVLLSSCKEKHTTDSPVEEVNSVDTTDFTPPDSSGPAIQGGGYVYFEGFKDSLMCGLCHTADYDTSYFVGSRTGEWSISSHSSSRSAEHNTYDCAGCHTTEGFIERAKKGFPSAFSGIYVSSYTNTAPVGCFACHSPHKMGDFSLRNNALPVLLKSNLVGTEDAEFNFGRGNLCVLCHQPRYVTPRLDQTRTDSVTITARKWSSHSGAQSQMLVGTGGFHFSGFIPQNASHGNLQTIKEKGCIVCHMFETSDSAIGKTGGHTMDISYEANGSIQYGTAGCSISGCHNAGGDLINYNNVRSSVESKLDTLFGLLGNKGYVDTISTSPMYGSVRLQDGRLTLPMQKAGALWNYFFVRNDKSKGAHNARYSLDLLEASIIEMKNQ